MAEGKKKKESQKFNLCDVINDESLMASRNYESYNHRPWIISDETVVGTILWYD